MAIVPSFNRHIHADIEALLEGLVLRTLYAGPRWMLFEAPDLDGLSQACKLLASCGLDFRTRSARPDLRILYVTLPQD